MKTKSIAYVSVLSALALAVVLFVNFVLPTSFVPLAFVSAIGLVTFYLCGWGGGIAFVFVVGILTFVFTGLNYTFFTLTVLFIPYIIYAYAIRNLNYTKSKKLAIIRILITLVFFYLTSIVTILVLYYLIGGTSESALKLSNIILKVGIYIAPLVYSLVALPMDFFISQLTIVAVDRINKQTKSKK